MQLFGFELFRAINQVANAFLSLFIGWTVRRRDKAVVRIFTGVHCPDAVELLKQDRDQQMVYREGIIGVALKDLIKLLNGAIIVHVVKVVERGWIDCVIRAKQRLF